MVSALPFITHLDTYFGNMLSNEIIVPGGLPIVVEPEINVSCNAKIGNGECKFYEMLLKVVKFATDYGVHKE